MMSWLSLIKQHHKGIEQAFDKCLNCADFTELSPLLKELSVSLVKHSKAEESSVYPALAEHGFRKGSRQLWDEQDHAGQLDKDILKLYRDKSSLKTIKDALSYLKKEVLVHAKDHEEKDYFPKLMDKLSPEENMEILRKYKESYAT